MNHLADKRSEELTPQLIEYAKALLQSHISIIDKEIIEFDKTINNPKLSEEARERAEANKAYYIDTNMDNSVNFMKVVAAFADAYHEGSIPQK